MTLAGLQDDSLNGHPGVLVSFDDSTKRWRAILRAGHDTADNTYKAGRPANLIKGSFTADFIYMTNVLRSLRS